MQEYVRDELESAKASVVHDIEEQKEMAMWEMDEYEGSPVCIRQIWKEYKQFESEGKTELERLQAEIEAAVARFAREDEQRKTEKLRLEMEKRAKHREDQAAIARLAAEAQAEKERIALDEEVKEREATIKIAKLEADTKAELVRVATENKLKEIKE